MQYQVLARKWRPQTFHDLVGQEHVSRTLINALQSGRVAHAFLFSGPRGSGKTTTARILAKALNCHTGKAAEPCGRCIACIEIAAGNCMDVLEIDAASNRGIDEIRDLKEKVRYNPARDRHRIFIIDEVHMLTAEAFNALLKTLEEPPGHVVFILATTEYHKIPATILSRCQQYSFKLIPFPIIFKRLKEIAVSEQIQISDAALEQVTFSSGGSMRDAMSALDQVIAFSGASVRDEDVTMLLGLVEPAVLGDMVRAIGRGDIDRILKVVAELVETGQDLQNFCRRLLNQFRNLMVLKAGVTESSVLGAPESLVPDLRAQAELYTREDLLRLFDALLRIEAELKYATQVRFQLEMGLIEISQLPKLRPLEDLIAEFSALVKDDAPAPKSSKPPSANAPQPSSNPEKPTGRSSSLPSKLSATQASTSQAGSKEVAQPEEPAQQLPAPNNPAGEASGLLAQIAAAIDKPLLESIVQGLPGARIDGDTVVLGLQGINDFYKKKINDNIALISDAASKALGRTVKVVCAGEAQPPPEKSSMPQPVTTGKSQLLEEAMREPVVRSFLDVFPGPVKAEEVDT